MKAFVRLIALTACLLGEAKGADLASYGSELQDRRCRGNSQLTGDCFAVHGRLFASNGTPSVRLWPVGTKRLFGVVPSEREILPPCLRGKFGFFAGTTIYGDFTVCRFTQEHPGAMRLVCIEEAEHLVTEKIDSRPPCPSLRGVRSWVRPLRSNGEASLVVLPRESQPHVLLRAV